MVEITTHHNSKCFEYKGIYISREFWEDAPFPINCENITDEQMKKMVVELYDILVADYGVDAITNYPQYLYGDVESTDTIDYEEIDKIRLTEEEDLFLKNGGFYYED